MTSHSYFFAIFIMLLFVGFLHVISVELALYWSFWWLDQVMHVLGGFVAGSFGLWFFFLFLKRSFQEQKNISILTTALLSALLVGLLWEVYELGLFDGARLHVYDRVFGRWTILDTAVDLFLDCVGSLIAGGVFLFLELSRKKRALLYSTKEKTK